MCLLRVYLLFLHLLAGIWLSGTSVSESFKDCSQFFYMRTAPTGIDATGGSLKRICQRYGNKPRYATLYDCSRRMPLYSAYTFKKNDGKKWMDTPWMYEPQLASGDEGGNMKMIPSSGNLEPLIQESQAVLEDYSDAVEFSRGLLNPDQHQAEPDDKASTYSLTNVVPQLMSCFKITDFLEETWSAYLDALRHRLNNFCRGKQTYMVTGVTVSGATIRRGNEDRLGIPKHLWLAYCCPRFDRNSPYEVRFMFPSYGAYALNKQEDHGVMEVPLKTLESFLKKQMEMDSKLSIFYKDCVSENTFKKRKK